MTEYATQTDPTAVVGRRFGAFIVDMIVLLAVPAALFFATAGIVLYESPTTCPQVVNAGQKSSSEVCIKVDAQIQDDKYTAATYKPAAWAIAGGVYLLYLVIVQWIVQGMTGATLGKALFGIRTVDEQGQPPGLGKQFIRGVVWIIDGLCDGLVAAIAILASKGHRRLGDMAAKTFVVRSSAKGAPIVVPGLAAAGAGAMAAGAVPVGGYAATPPAPGTPYTPPSPATPYTPPAASDQTVVTPEPDQTVVAPTAPAAPPAPPTDGPVWDAARNAYIQWDPAGNRWLTYDDAAAQWKPIEGDQPPTPPA